VAGKYLSYTSLQIKCRVRLYVKWSAVECWRQIHKMEQKYTVYKFVSMTNVPFLMKQNSGSYCQQNINWSVAIEFYQVLLVVTAHELLSSHITSLLWSLVIHSLTFLLLSMSMLIVKFYSEASLLRLECLITTMVDCNIFTDIPVIVNVNPEFI